MFPTYRFNDRRSEAAVRVGKSSYVAAGVFGAVYLFFKAGHARLVQGVALSLGCTLAIMALVAGSSILSPHQQLSVIVAGVPAILAVQSAKTMALVLSSYRRLGWRVRRED